MPRYFAPITPVDLRDKVLKSFGNLSNFFYGNSLARMDLKKVQFDAENYVEEPCDGHLFENLLGIRTLDNGLTMWGLFAGGDWEFGVFSVLYWSGKEIRGYVPKDGNTWNYKTKAAFGNEGNFDDDDTIHELDSDEMQDKAEMQFDEKKIIADIKKRLLPKPITKSEIKAKKIEAIKAKMAASALSKFHNADLIKELENRGFIVSMPMGKKF